MKKIFYLMLTVLGAATFVHKNYKKIKATAAKVAKVDGAGMVLFLITEMHTIRENANLFSLITVQTLIITNTQGSWLYCSTFQKNHHCQSTKGIIGVKYATDRIEPLKQ
jgi:phage terminase large subunit-like protein